MAGLAMLADIQRTVYLQGGHPSTACHGAGQGKFACQIPTFYPLCNATKMMQNSTDCYQLAVFHKSPVVFECIHLNADYRIGLKHYSSVASVREIYLTPESWVRAGIKHQRLESMVYGFVWHRYNNAKLLLCLCTKESCSGWKAVVGSVELIGSYKKKTYFLWLFIVGLPFPC